MPEAGLMFPVSPTGVVLGRSHLNARQLLSLQTQAGQSLPCLWQDAEEVTTYLSKMKIIAQLSCLVIRQNLLPPPAARHQRHFPYGDKRAAYLRGKVRSRMQRTYLPH